MWLCSDNLLPGGPCLYPHLILPLSSLGVKLFLCSWPLGCATWSTKISSLNSGTWYSTFQPLWCAVELEACNSSSPSWFHLSCFSSSVSLFKPLFWAGLIGTAWWELVLQPQKVMELGIALPLCPVSFPQWLHWARIKAVTKNRERPCVQKLVHLDFP